MPGGGAQKSVGEEQVSVGFEVSLAPTTCFRSGGTKARNLSFLNRNFFFMYRSPGFPGRDPAQPLPSASAAPRRWRRMFPCLQLLVFCSGAALRNSRNRVRKCALRVKGNRKGVRDAYARGRRTDPVAPEPTSRPQGGMESGSARRRRPRCGFGSPFGNPKPPRPSATSQSLGWRVD